MTAWFAVAGGVLGALLPKLPGIVIGAALGGLLGLLLSQGRRLARLEEYWRKEQISRQYRPSAPPREPSAEETPRARQSLVAQAAAENVPGRPLTAGESAASMGRPTLAAAEAEDQNFTWTAVPGRSEPEQAPTLLPEAFRRFFTSGNLLVKVGVVILFFGVAFLLKYAAQRQLFPIELRLTGVALGGMGLLGAGWLLRLRRPAFALPLQGGGIGILYLTIFAALRLYHLLPSALALPLLIGIAFCSAALAVLQNTRSLAVLGAAGGFLAPVLASTGSGSHIQLFSYYAVLNFAILGIAWFRSWRILNLTGFIFTFGIGSLWGARYYRPEHFATVEPFLLLFFLIYLAIAILFALRQPPDLRGWLDGTLIFGTPLVAFGLQAPLVRNWEYGVALSALVLGAIYLPLARFLFRRPGLTPLVEVFLALGTIFATLAVPFAFDGRWTAAFWALEGAGIVWIGVRQRRLPARLFGILLQLAAGGMFLHALPESGSGLPLLNGFWLGALVVSLAALFSSRQLQRESAALRPEEGWVSPALLLWGLFWWYGAGLTEIGRHLSFPDRLGSAVLLFAFTCVLCDLFGRRLAWPRLRGAALLLLPALAILLLLTAADHSHPLARVALPAWPAAFAVQLWLLRRREEAPPSLFGLLHAGTLWLVAAVGAWEAAWRIGRWLPGAQIWVLVAWGIVPGLLLLLAARGDHRLAWPLRRHRESYLTAGAAPLAAFAWGWASYANLTAAGDPWPLPYLPLLNPLDAALGLVFLVLFIWQRELLQLPPDRRRHLPAPPLAGALAAGLFLWLTAAVARTVHHWGGVPFNSRALYHSVLLQTSLSLAWTLTALGIMLLATRLGRRPAWLGGAVLLGVVVFKLFLLDLAGIGTVARIVSFIGVGLLLLVIGYFSPAPPKMSDQEVSP